MSYREIYPTGRKHCSRCKRWRPLIDFGVRKWIDIERTVPRLLSSRCMICEARAKRAKNGHKLREWYAHGVPGSATHREHIREMNRASARKRREDPGYRAEQSEYWRIWNNAKRGAISRLTIRVTEDHNRRSPTVRVDNVPFFAWLDQEPGVEITEAERLEIRRAKAQGNIRLTVVDAVMTRHGDHYLVAILYDIDAAA